LELKSEISKAPTVSRKDNKPGKIIFVKERVERSFGPFAEQTKHK